MGLTMNAILSNLLSHAEFVQAVLAQLSNKLLGNCLGQNNLALCCPASSRSSANWQVTIHPQRTIQSEQPD